MFLKTMFYFVYAQILGERNILMVSFNQKEKFFFIYNISLMGLLDLLKNYFNHLILIKFCFRIFKDEWMIKKFILISRKFCLNENS